MPRIDTLMIIDYFYEPLIRLGIVVGTLLKTYCKGENPWRLERNMEGKEKNPP